MRTEYDFLEGIKSSNAHLRAREESFRILSKYQKERWLRHNEVDEENVKKFNAEAEIRRCRGEEC